MKGGKEEREGGKGKEGGEEGGVGDKERLKQRDDKGGKEERKTEGKGGEKKGRNRKRSMIKEASSISCGILIQFDLNAITDVVEQSGG